MSYKQDLPEIKRISSNLINERNKYALSIANILKLNSIDTIFKNAGVSCIGNTSFHKDDAPSLDRFTKYNVITINAKDEDKVKDLLVSKMKFEDHGFSYSKNGKGVIGICGSRNRHLAIYSGPHEIDENDDYNALREVSVTFGKYECSEEGYYSSSKVITFRSAIRDKIIGLANSKYERINDSLYKSKKGVYIVVSNNQVSLGTIPVVLDKGIDDNEDELYEGDEG